MPQVAPLQSDFSVGELSPKLYGRVDIDRYAASLRVCKNSIPPLEGGIERRPGTEFIAEGYNAVTANRHYLVPFIYGTTDTFMLEFSDQKLRFYRDYGLVISGSTPYEIATPYTSADLAIGSPQLNYTQSADVVYLVHPNHAPRKLLRYSNTDWVLEKLTFLDGPYQSQNIRDFNITPSASSGSGVTLTAGPAVTISGASAHTSGEILITAAAHGYRTNDRVFIASVTGTTEANGTWLVQVIDSGSFVLKGSTFASAYVSGGTSRPALFYNMEAGNLVRMKEGTTWGWAVITSLTNDAAAVVTVEKTFTNTNAKTAWRLGLYSASNYPSTVTFHEDRLFFSGAPLFPQRVDGSQSSDYENFAPTELDGTVLPSNAVSFGLNSNDVNASRWLVSDEKGMIGGTLAAEWIISSSSSTEAISPTSITAKKASTFGSSLASPVQLGKAVIFTQRSGRKLREFQYFFDVDGFRATDLTKLSGHITGDGIFQMAAQKQPYSIVWAARKDGVLLGMTYERDLDTIRAGWHRHPLGIGPNDPNHNTVFVESVAVMPSPDGFQDDVWLSVRRKVDGVTKRYIECINSFFSDRTEQKDAFFVDSGLTYDVPVAAVTGTISGSAVNIEATGHGFTTGDVVAVYGITTTDYIREGQKSSITVVNANNFTLDEVDGVAFQAYLGGGTTFGGDSLTVRKCVTTISGLDHLEGARVDVLADGAVLPSKTVISGAITISPASAVIHVGLGYVSEGQMGRIEAGAADGVALGKIRRIHKVNLLLHRTLGLEIGTGLAADQLHRPVIRTSADPGNFAPELFSGMLEYLPEFDYDKENYISWRQTQPLPYMILGVMPQMVTQDG